MTLTDWTHTVVTCSSCLASWYAPKDEPHACLVQAADARAEIAEHERDQARHRVAELEAALREIANDEWPQPHAPNPVLLAKQVLAKGKSAE